MSKYEALKAESRRRNIAIVNLYPVDGPAPESEDIYNAEVSAGLAEATQANYERAAAEMHEELVEAAVYLASAVGKNFVPDRILALIERAKAL